MSKFETLVYEEQDGVAWVILNRPGTLNSFTAQMQHELPDTWRALRKNDAVRAIVLTGAGDKAFCTGIDRVEAMADYGKPDAKKEKTVGTGSAPASRRGTSAGSCRRAPECCRPSSSPSTWGCGRRGSIRPASAARPGSSWSSSIAISEDGVASTIERATVALAAEMLGTGALAL